MTAILDLPEVRQRISPLTVEEYGRLDEFNENGKRTELIRGIVIEKMSKSPLHASIVIRLVELMSPLLPDGFHARQDQPLEFADSVPEPDFALVRGLRKDFAQKHPTAAALVVEVAFSSVALDREMALLYAEAGVDEYWIILTKEQAVEVYRHPVDGVYQEKTLLASHDALNCMGVPGLRVSVSEIFA